MKIFVTGANGMAGHMIFHYFDRLPNVEVYGSIRGPSQHPRITRLDLTDEQATFAVLQHIRPDVVINAAGILNEEANKRLKEAIYINSLLPHVLAKYGDMLDFKFIHISTDCVFSGLKGDYRENDQTDGTTVYAKTKSLGEVIEDKHLTIRTSIIGPEIRQQGIGLFQWFMKQNGQIKGFRHVYWNGVTTLQLSKAIAWLIPKNINGLVHLARQPKISKYDLLCLLKDEFNKEDIHIEPSDVERVDKSLMNTRGDLNFNVPSYYTMIRELKQWMESHPKRYAHYMKGKL